MQRLRLWQNLSFITGGVTAAVLSLQGLGVLQLLEWATLNHWFRLRPLESRTVPIVLVLIHEPDIQWLTRWPMSDAQLSLLIRRVKRDRPIAIGLDLYRDLPVEPGHRDLLHLFRTTPNLIGIMKVISGSQAPAVLPPPILEQHQQVGANDLLVDADGVVRRNLLSVEHNQRDVLSLGAKLALIYLAQQNITPHQNADRSQVYLGKATFERLSPDAGGYTRADTGGFQTLSNYLQVRHGVPSISLMQVMLDQIPPGFFQDKLVFIGTKAESLWGDRFYTPYTTDAKTTWSGVEIHANLAAQIITSAVDGRSGLHALPEHWEWLWVLWWAASGMVLGWSLRSVRQAVILLPSLLSLIFLSAYIAFLLGWWMVAIAPALAFITSGLLGRGYWMWQTLKHTNSILEQKVQARTQELIEKNIALEQAQLAAETANRALERLAHTDELTQVANRRFFNQYLYQEWQHMSQAQLPLSLILIDIDYFKLYNDTYGHPAGDDCLAKVAAVLRASVQQTTDLVARYGGEEFAIVLPNTPNTEALQIANRIQANIHTLAIPHRRSQAGSYVTLSMGIACLFPTSDFSPAQFIGCADEALYQAKRTGRDRSILLDRPPEQMS